MIGWRDLLIISIGASSELKVTVAEKASKFLCRLAPQASQVHVSRKSEGLFHENTTRDGLQMKHNMMYKGQTTPLPHVEFEWKEI